MQIVVLFQFNGEAHPSAVTGIEGEVTDFILPNVGDVVEHCDFSGSPFRGRVTDRIYKYDLPKGELLLDGAISVKLCMDPTTVH